MKKYEVLYMDRHVEIVDFDTVDKLIDELECSERWDVPALTAFLLPRWLRI